MRTAMPVAVYINAGASAGVKPGDRFTVTAVVRELTDPDSGALLGIVEDKCTVVIMQSCTAVSASLGGRQIDVTPSLGSQPGPG